MVLDDVGDDDPFDYSVNLETRAVIFDCGWIAPIVRMFDDEGDDTDELDEVCYVAVKLPEIGVVPLCVMDDGDEWDWTQH